MRLVTSYNFDLFVRYLGPYRGNQRDARLQVSYVLSYVRVLVALGPRNHSSGKATVSQLDE